MIMTTFVVVDMSCRPPVVSMSSYSRMRTFWAQTAFFAVFFADLHNGTCSSAGKSSADLTNDRGKSGADPFASTRSTIVHMADMRASCVAKQDMEQGIAGPMCLAWCHRPSHQSRLPLLSPRVPRCSCEASVAKVKAKTPIMVLIYLHHRRSKKKISSWILL